MYDRFNTSGTDGIILTSIFVMAILLAVKQRSAFGMYISTLTLRNVTLMIESRTEVLKVKTNVLVSLT